MKVIARREYSTIAMLNIGKFFRVLSRCRSKIGEIGLHYTLIDNYLST